MRKLEEIIAEILKIDVEAVTDELGAENCEEWGSLAHVQIISELEETYEIEFDAMESMDMDSVGAIKEVLSSKGVSF